MAFLTDGYQCIITMANAPGLAFMEKEVHPPSIKGGGGIDMTNMRQAAVAVPPTSAPRTQLPKHLYSVGDTTCMVEYNSTLYSVTSIPVLINRPTVVTITFPDGNTESFNGWLDEFTPGPLKEGELPTAEIKFCYSGLNTGTWSTTADYTAAVTPPVMIVNNS